LSLTRSGWRLPDPATPRWSERLAALDLYVRALGQRPSERNALRRNFYDACRARKPDEAMMACEGPVGIGKTTAVLAYLLRRAEATGARRLFVVAPYTAILSQTAQRLREALLDGAEKARVPLHMLASVVAFGPIFVSPGLIEACAGAGITTPAVAPFAGAWIETITRRSPEKNGGRSPPSRGRGSKP
jgi:hypothetical protein